MKIRKGWKRFWIVLGVLIVGLWITKVVLIDQYPSPEENGFTVDWTKVRALAKGDSAEMPIRLNSKLVAIETVPEFVTYAGGGVFESPLAMRVHQLMYADRSVIIDPVHNEALHRQNNYGGPFYQEAYDQMQEALRKADLIVATHEHFDHVGGISTSPYFDEIREKVILNEQQMSNKWIKEAAFTDAQLNAIKPITYQDYYSPNPGMVLIKSPGHSPGHQMIYVQLLNGKEYLFVGDIAWRRRNIDDLNGRPKLVSNLLGENAQGVANQLYFLQQTTENEPIHIIVSHDHEDHLKQIEENLYANELE